MPQSCRHCKQEIADGARRCHHCHGHQSWVADQHDPRTKALIFVPLLVFVGLAIAVVHHAARETQSRLESLLPGLSSPLEVISATGQFDLTASGTQAYVLVQIRNPGSRLARDVIVRVEFLKSDGLVRDTFTQRLQGFSLVPGAQNSYRVTALVPPCLESEQLTIRATAKAFANP